ncbi:hypothetical protein FACS1894195_4860 [Bacteroidia bacterium]|nr:hypothetical protein FACS1894195_4860 [Bacteroidia bacterium]
MLTTMLIPITVGLFTSPKKSIATMQIKINPREDPAFLELCEFAETVIKRRIEQLPEVVMVDITGLVGQRLQIMPDKNLTETAGITLTELENALISNNIEPGSMTVRDGYYEYNIKFSALLRTLQDVENIYLNKNGHKAYSSATYASHTAKRYSDGIAGRRGNCALEL